jgi:transcriptional regulator with XRE-family HTH domain
MKGRSLVARNVRRIRVRKGISQERLAFDSGIDRSYLGGVERATENPTVDLLDRLAVTLEVPLAELFAEPGGNEGTSPGLKRGRRRIRPARNPGA